MNFIIVPYRETKHFNTKNFILRRAKCTEIWVSVVKSFWAYAHLRLFQKYRF